MLIKTFVTQAHALRTLSEKPLEKSHAFHFNRYDILAFGYEL